MQRPSHPRGCGDGEGRRGGWRLWLRLIPLVLISCGCQGCRESPTADPPRTFRLKGVVKDFKPDGRTVVIKHEEIPGYMAAMTMPFRVKETNGLPRLTPGMEISFRLSVTEERSWIDEVRPTGRVEPPGPTSAGPSAAPSAPPSAHHPLLDYKFTNQFGRPVSFNDFKGRVIAYTFFFTRCPIPEYCPRLSRNFQEASAKLKALPDAPTNWQFISVSFDTSFDTPAVLRAYAERYHYDSNHWTFLTGPTEKIAELAQLSGVNYSPDEASLFDHGFRTLVIDPAGGVQMSYPIGGDLSDELVEDILAAAGR